MGGWKATDAAVYVVSWDDEGIVKAGYSAVQRWRAFVIRGARVVKVTYYPHWSEAFDAELLMHTQLRQIWPLAFASATEARPYLGGSGDGYKECYRMLASNASSNAERAL